MQTRSPGEVLCERYTQRVENPDEKGNYICCGNVLPRGLDDQTRPEYLREDLCRRAGWSPDDHQRSVYTFWDQNLEHERKDPSRFGLEIRDDYISCRDRTSLPFRVDLLGEESFFCNERIANEDYDTRNIYSGTYGALREAEILLPDFNRCDDGSCETPFTELLDKRDDYKPSMQLGESSGCGKCPKGYKCQDYKCVEKGGEEDKDKGKNKKFPTWAIVTVSILGAILLAILISMPIVYSQRKKSSPPSEQGTEMVDLSPPQQISL